MTNITRVIKDLIEANTYAEITANVGNTEPVTVDSIVYADQTWANTSNTSVLTTGGYIKLYGKGFETNANVLFGSTVATANVQSANEVRVNVPALSTGTYTMFLYNPSGSNAIKYKSIPVQGDYNYGWFSGGLSGTSVISSVERIQFSNDTVNTDIRGALPRNIVFASAAGTKDNGYIIGGADSAGRDSGSNLHFNSTVYRITYANDETSASIRAALSPVSNRWRAATSSKNYGYISGGSLILTASPASVQIPGQTSTNRLDFSSDSDSLTSKGPLSLARLKLSATSNDNYGWYIGGTSTTYWYVPSLTGTTNYSIIDRLNFSSDTNNCIVRGPLNTTSSLNTTTTDSNQAWISAGLNYFGGASSNYTFGSPSSNFQRMTFANDNLTAVSRVSSTVGIQSGSGDSNYGWFSGGIDLTGLGSPASAVTLDQYAPTVSSIFRLTYASDTTAASNRSSFFQARKFHTGNSGVVS